MLFNSYQFIFIFLPISALIYFYLNSRNLTTYSKIFLVLSSLFFYSWWNVKYLPLILISMIFNYTIGKNISKNRQTNKTLLTIGISFNLLALGYFKYADFLIENINLVANTNIKLLHLALPLAISFFTFQQISYLVDSYKKETKEYDFLNYALFVTFFPQLIAGPIVHHKEMMPQFADKKNKNFNINNIALGIFIFSIGLFKKVIIADTLSVWATNGFDIATNLTLFDGWVTSLSYTFQLYFDFSGYTDMAIGAALIFNIKLPINFNSPYKALSIQDFWRRWHITLSRFLKDYIYIPLGGNRGGQFKTYRNLLVTFILGGIWHGAGWTFVFWGFLHGLALIIHRYWNYLGYRFHHLFAWFLTFNFLNISWIFFRAKEWKDAIKVLSSMFDFTNIVLPVALSSKLAFLKQIGVKFGGFIIVDNSSIIWIFTAFILILMYENSMHKMKNFNFTYKSAIFSGILFCYAIVSLNHESEFLYFNF